MRVLIVEDDEATLLTLQDVFSEYLPEFELCALSDSSNYEERIVALGEFDVVILDVYLGMSVSGDYVAQWMRQQTQYQKTPLIAFTADSVIESEHLLKAGFDAVIIKPIRDVHLFVMQVKRVIAGESFVYND